jgi:Tfp pilus assembly protein PilO
MEGVMALMIPIVAVGGFFAWMISLSPVGKAYAEKVRGQAAHGAGDNAEVLESLEQLRHEVAELAERVDFTERLLAKQREGARIGPA